MAMCIHNTRANSGLSSINVCCAGGALLSAVAGKLGSYSTHVLPQQKHPFDIIQIHAQQGGFSVVMGEPGVGKTVLREHIESLDKQREFSVVSCSRTLHTYPQISWQLVEAFKL